MVVSGYGEYDLTVDQTHMRGFDHCPARTALLVSVRGVKRVHSPATVSSSARCFRDGTFLQALGQALAGVPTSPLVFGRMLTGCQQVETIRDGSRSDKDDLQAKDGLRTNLDLSLCASVTAVMAAKEVCRLVENDVENRFDSLQKVRTLSRRSLGYAMLAAGITFGTDWPPRGMLTFVDIAKAKRSFVSDLRVLRDSISRSVKDNRIIGPSYPELEAAPFGRLWKNNDPPSWFGRDGDDTLAPSVLDGDTGTDDAGSDVVYFHIPTADAPARIPAIIERMEATRQKAAEGVETPAYVIHAPDLDPALAGDLMAAGAFLLPDDAFQGGRDARDLSAVRQRIGELLPDVHHRGGTEVVEDDWLSTPPFSSPSGGWAADGTDGEGEDSLAAAQRRYRERLAAEARFGYWG